MGLLQNLMPNLRIGTFAGPPDLKKVRQGEEVNYDQSAYSIFAISGCSTTNVSRGVSTSTYSDIIQSLIVKGTATAPDAFSPSPFFQVGSDVVCTVSTFDPVGSLNPYNEWNLLWGMYVQLNLSQLNLANTPINVNTTFNNPFVIDNTYDFSGTVTPSATNPVFGIIAMKTVRQFTANQNNLLVPTPQTTVAFQPVPFTTSAQSNSAVTLTLTNQLIANVRGSAMPLFIHPASGEVAANLFGPNCALN